MAPKLTLTTINLGAPDAPALARFYQRLLGYEIVAEEPNWVLMRPNGPGLPLSVQHEPHYTAPVWPGVADRPGMMMHLEIGVDDLPGSVAHALACGATEAEFQPQDDVRVLLDPAGHPFCLWLDSEN
jgi:catechol 2,3-dioxygenase-like lactoylglutathione lyase family enzyme